VREGLSAGGRRKEGKEKVNKNAGVGSDGYGNREEGVQNVGIRDGVRKVRSWGITKRKKIRVFCSNVYYFSHILFCS
jgi:hypothetical protein